jgi:hypothetical protein
MTRALALALAILAGALPCPASAAPGDKADISRLSDLAFGQLNMTTDQTLSESVCAYSSSATSGYAVQATGDGAGTAFTLSNGSTTLPYEVRWSDSSGQTNGTALTAGATVSGFISSASQKTCNNGPASSATLLVTIRAAASGSAQVGDYSGVLTLTLVPQ